MEIAQNFMGKKATNTMVRINENGNVVGTIIVNREGLVTLAKQRQRNPVVVVVVVPAGLTEPNQKPENIRPTSVAVALIRFPETTTLDSLTAATYSTHMRNLSHYASNALKEIDVTDELVVLRLVSRKTEAVVAPDPEFHLIVVMRRT